jgi:hypothetical protein
VIAWAMLAATEVNYAPFTPAKPPVEITDTDHEAIRLRPGLGYFGQLDSVHMFGLRYWFRRSVGLDVALGGRGESGSERRSFAVAARVSLPLAYLTEKHITMFVAPSLGYTQGGETVIGQPAVSPITGLTQTPPDSHHTRTLVTAGARIGGELHFGFLGVQRLSLIGTFGIDAAYTREWNQAAGPSTTRDPVPRAVESRSNVVRAATDWNAAVIYYF